MLVANRDNDMAVPVRGCQLPVDTMIPQSLWHKLLRIRDPEMYINGVRQWRNESTVVVWPLL